MCVSSAIIDNWMTLGPDHFPTIWPTLPATPGVNKEEFNELRREVSELKELLKAAKKFDAATGQPNCEHEEKIALVKRIAELVGVDMADIV